mmetsp:Transcript_24716/g.43959  ORF Transcript_24716/g.43959 Transcript_24716/m.43959 type:complete len:278 (+) Transcript_24716:113-946(+)
MTVMIMNDAICLSNARFHFSSTRSSVWDRALLSSYVSSTLSPARNALHVQRWKTITRISSVARFLELSVLYNLVDRHHSESKLSAEGTEFRRPRHCSVSVDYLTQHSRRVQSGHSRKIYSCLRMSRSRQYTAFLRPQREDVSGSSKILRLRFALCQRHDSFGTIARRNASCSSMLVVDGDRERSLVAFGVVVHHLRQFELIAARRLDTDTDDAAGVIHHECHGFRCGFLRCDDEVSFVFAARRVLNYNKLAIFDVLNRPFHIGDRIDLLSLFLALLF